MKPQFLKPATGQVQSFSTRRDVVPYVNNRWHYHQEIELVYFKKGHGTQFIGDSIRPFRSGDVMLVGSGLPHYWQFAEEYFSEESEADTWVVHFSRGFWGEAFLQLPETKKIVNLLERARAGIKLTSTAAETVAGFMAELLEAEGIERIILLLKALTCIATDHGCILLSSVGFRANFDQGEDSRLNAVFEYSLHQFKQRVELRQVANIANISPHSFCRYFKLRTGKTYSQFMIEVRVGQACRLLIDNRMSVKPICYESGFHNFASFHKYFKQITGKSPLNYQQEYTGKNHNHTGGGSMERKRSSA
jgi:AraC-like DNA-binding protein